jgi:hypothetical protein
VEQHHRPPKSDHEAARFRIGKSLGRNALRNAADTDLVHSCRHPPTDARHHQDAPDATRSTANGCAVGAGAATHANGRGSTQLSSSPRTVEWRLREVLTKLGSSSRKELSDVLSTQ